MYKKQLKAQKIVCLLAIVVAVILFLYSLGIMTDLYDALYGTLRISIVDAETAAKQPAGSYMITTEDGTYVATERSSGSGTIVFFTMQPFNKMLVNYSIVYIIIAAILFVTNTSTRRRYYISNYISIGLFTAASLYIPIFAHPYIERFKADFKAVDFEYLKSYSETYKSTYTESTMWFDLHYVVFALMIIAAVALVAICVWKVTLMKEERRLVEEGKKVKS